MPVPHLAKVGVLAANLYYAGGTTEKGSKAAAEEYYSNIDKYPYQVYINWSFTSSVGNLLYNDKKFVRCSMNTMKTISH